MSEWYSANPETMAEKSAYWGFVVGIAVLMIVIFAIAGGLL